MEDDGNEGEDEDDTQETNKITAVQQEMRTGVRRLNGVITK